MTGILTLIMSRQVINKWHLSAHITVLNLQYTVELIIIQSIHVGVSSLLGI